MEAEKSFKKKTVARTSNARLVILLSVALPLLGFSLYSWIARPAFIWGPAARPMLPAEADANLRMAMFLLGMRLDAYREERGYYPASLDAIGESLPGVSYELVTDSIFELRGVVGQHPIIFRSDMTADEYLGKTKSIISGSRSRR